MNAKQQQKIANMGGIAALVGIASSVLSFFESNLVLLVWIDIWGETIVWVLRVGLIVVGAVIYFKMEVDDKDLFPEEKEE